jgi:hypothetical protein
MYCVLGGGISTERSILKSIASGRCDERSDFFKEASSSAASESAQAQTAQMTV